MPEANPVMAKFGELVVEAVLLFKLGGVPVASKVANRFELPVELVIELDICVRFLRQIFPDNPDSSRDHHRCFYDKISDGA
jgi:hypothetical protein